MESGDVTIYISLRKWNGSDQDEEPLVISGPPDALYRDLVDTIVTNREGGYPFIDFVDEDSGQHFALLIDRSATMAEVADALGEDIHAKPPTLMLGGGGRGGGAGFTLGALLQAAEGLKQVGEWVGIGLMTWKAIVAGYFRTTRRLAKDWIDTDEISMELRQAVLAHNPWERGDFDTVFKLGNRGPTLLRAIGYEREMRYGERWWELGNRGRRF